ncbi:MAG: hypothetical protein ACKN9T_08550, partial [Candidatus Methylumidiphilus sp.]
MAFSPWLKIQIIPCVGDFQPVAAHFDAGSGPQEGLGVFYGQAFGSFWAFCRQISAGYPIRLLRCDVGVGQMAFAVIVPAPSSCCPPSPGLVPQPTLDSLASALL